MDASGASPSEGSTQDVEPPEPETSVVPRPTLELESTGATPRRALRWTFEKGAQATIDLSMDMRVNMTMDGKTQPGAPTPAILSTLDLTVQEVDEAGTALIGFAVTKAGVRDNPNVPAAAAAQIRSDLETVVGLEGSYRCEASGFVPEVKAQPPPQASAAVRQAVENIRQSLRQMTALLPEEPVGRGAKWTLLAKYPFSGMNVTERATFTLKTLKFPTVVVDASIEQTAPPQTLTGADGRTGDLESLRSQATGSNHWNLEDLGALSAVRETSMSMTMKGPGNDGQEHSVTLAIEFDLQVDTK